MITFFILIVLFFAGNFFYSRFPERIMGGLPNTSIPAYTLQDGAGNELNYW